MPEETPKMCSTCHHNSADMCPVRKGCHFPNYDNWAPIVEEDKENPGWEIISFMWNKSDGHLFINIKSNAGLVLPVHISADDIAGLVLPAGLKEEIDNH